MISVLKVNFINIIIFRYLLFCIEEKQVQGPLDCELKCIFVTISFNYTNIKTENFKIQSASIIKKLHAYVNSHLR